MSEHETAKIADLPPLSKHDRDVSNAWVRDALWAELADLFDKYREEQGLSYAALGRRLDRTRGQVQRWLDAPNNMTLCSAGLMAEGLDADFSIVLSPRRADASGCNRVFVGEDAKSFVRATPVPVTYLKNKENTAQGASSQLSKNHFLVRHGT